MSDFKATKEIMKRIPRGSFSVWSQVNRRLRVVGVCSLLVTMSDVVCLPADGSVEAAVKAFQGSERDDSEERYLVISYEVRCMSEHPMPCWFLVRGHVLLTWKWRP